MLGYPSASELICLQKMHWATQGYDKKPEPKQDRTDALLPPRYLALCDFCPDMVVLWVRSFSSCGKVGSITQDNPQEDTLVLAAERLHGRRNKQGAKGWQSHRGEV